MSLCRPSDICKVCTDAVLKVVGEALCARMKGPEPMMRTRGLHGILMFPAFQSRVLDSATSSSDKVVNVAYQGGICTPPLLLFLV